MYVRHLSVSDFRNWTNADLDFEPGPSVLVGSNGQGKTNLIEALGYRRDAGESPRARPMRHSSEPVPNAP